MSRSAPTDPVPTESYLGRVHEYRADVSGELRLVAISPGCVCADCARLRATRRDGQR